MNHDHPVSKRAHEVITPEIVTWAPPEQPSWDRAKKYATSIRGGAEAIVKLGLELVALRQAFFSKGGRPEKNSGHPVPSLDNSLTNGEYRQRESGWQAKVQEELGISHKTAMRWIERAHVIIEFNKLKAGQSVEYTPTGKKTTRTLEPTPEVLERVDDALDMIVTGTMAAPRAFAGVVGEAARRGKQNGIAHKAPTDHAANIRTALTKLKTSLEFWNKMSTDQRSDLEKIWTEDVWGVLPDTWKLDDNI